MIVRDEGGTLVLITQPDHAFLAGQIAAAIRSELALQGPHREAVLLAAREHDNGWIEVDAEPTVDPATGRPCDFMSGPTAVKHELWLRGIARVATMDPRAGALVAEHALVVYGYRRGASDWRPFFESITAMRDDLLERLRIRDAAGCDMFHAQYRSVRLADAFSLQFCGGWSEPSSTLGYTVVMEGRALLISPDPFGGATVPLRVLGRRIAARPYETDGDLRAAVAAARPFVVEGTALGSDSIVEDPQPPCEF